MIPARMLKDNLAFCAQDASFGPASICRPVDFTLKFEQTILTFLPDVLFLVLFILRFAYLQPQSSKLKRTGWPLLTSKLMAVVAIVATNLASFAQATNALHMLPMWSPAPVLQLLITAPLSILVYSEHFRSLTPSTVVICYGLVKGLLASIILRTYIKIGLLREPETANASTAWAAVILSYFALVGTEMVEKRRLLKEKALPVVSTCSFLTRSLYSWLLPLLWEGRQKTLTLDDCGQVPVQMRAQPTRVRLQRALDESAATPNYLFVASMKAFGLPFFSPALPRVLLLLATFSQPILVNRMIGFAAESDKPSSEGWALVSGFVCVYALIALSTSLYWEKVHDVTVQYRGALVGAVYSKALRLSSSVNRSLGSGVASTYMSVDVERVCEAVQIAHEMCASLFSIPIAVAIIYQQVSWPAFLPLAATTVFLTFASIVGRKVAQSRAEWLSYTDRRVKFLSSIIQNFLPIKWSSYEDVLAEKTARLRDQETKGAKNFYFQLLLTAAVGNSADTICMAAVLGAYSTLASARENGRLDTRRLFTVVTAVSLLATPLNLLVQLLPQLAAGYASLKRIQEFLLSPERQLTVHEERDVGRDDDDLEATPILRMRKCSFSWTPGSDPFLRNLSLELVEPQLYMCIGPVASGKSLFLTSILGESTCVDGSLSLPDCRIAYASQDAFIIPGTVRENIVFGHPFDEERYLNVLDACALTADVMRLKKRDGTLLGEKGTRFSGGQRQRVALARAVYARAPWTLLDDPLSALDAETEEHVFRSLFGPRGLLEGRPVILVMHSVKHLESAKQILVFDDGGLLYNGTLKEIVENGFQPTNGLIQGQNEESDETGDSTTERGDEHIEEHEDDEAPLAAASRGLTPYIFYARMSTFERATITIIIKIGLGIMRLGLRFYLKAWSESKGRYAAVWAGGYTAYALVMVPISFFAFQQFGTTIMEYAARNIHASQIQGLFRTAPSYFMLHPAGQILNRLSQDIFTIDFDFPLAVLNIVISVVEIAGNFVFTFLPAPRLTFLLLPLGLMYFLTLRLYVSTSKQLQHLETSSKSPLYTLFSTTVGGLETIRAFRGESFFQRQSDTRLDRSQRPLYFRFGTTRFLRTVLAIMSFVLAVGLATVSVALREQINTALLGLALLSVTSLSGLLSYTVMNIARLENGSVAVSRIHEVASLPPEESQHKTDKLLSRPTFDSPWPSAGSLQFSDVTLRYKAGLELALQGISFQVQPGEKIGICGRTGSGKSSLILALFRGLDGSQIGGEIVIDGVNTHDISVKTLRVSLSLVAQDPFLWHSSLRENLDPEQTMTDEELWFALRKVGMGNAVSELPDKLETITEDGGSFSKGQRQLLCLARILLRKSKIVVLDEASSSLDMKTDEHIREVIRTELAGCTILAVAHRIATIVDFDRILVLDEGRIVENGAPQELLRRPGSKFTRLAASQGIQVD